ncbi:hypothetical protein O9993_20320 [Vibrio lentus]|nr:hypothetical protein [Vibrio lentus]
MAHDERHGYHVVAQKKYWQTEQSAWDHEQIVKHLKSQPTYGDLVPAVVTDVDAKKAHRFGLRTKARLYRMARHELGT